MSAATKRPSPIQDGETILLCRHAPIGDFANMPVGTFHWHGFADGVGEASALTFIRPDGTQGSARWAAICDQCFYFGGGVDNCISQDATWNGEAIPIRGAN